MRTLPLHKKYDYKMEFVYKLDIALTGTNIYPSTGEHYLIKYTFPSKQKAIQYYKSKEYLDVIKFRERYGKAFVFGAVKTTTEQEFADIEM
jgi:hypothetical protein